MSDDSDLVEVSGSLRPGEYRCVWDIGGRHFDGTLELRESLPPIGDVQGSLNEGEPVLGKPGQRVLKYPHNTEFEEVRGFLKDERAHVLLSEVSASTWFTDRTLLHPAAAVVGRGEPPGSTFSTATMQVTNLDRFSGMAPLSSQQHPYKQGTSRTWTATADNFHREWVGSHSEGTFYYGYKSSIDPYLMSVRFMPWLEIKSHAPLGIRPWFEQWGYPLSQLISAATGHVEKVTHLRVEAENGDTYTVFANPITQRPFYSERRGTEHLAFTAADDDFSLVRALETWSTLKDEKHPLVSRYNAMALSAEQHPRARVAFLIELLEASFGHENQAQWRERQVHHNAARLSLKPKLKKLRDSGVITREEFDAASRIPSQVFPQLSAALKHYVDAHAYLGVEDSLGKLDIVQAQSGKSYSVLDALRVIRNDIAHGTEDYETSDLRELAKALHPLIRAEFLRLLGGSFSLDW